MIRPLAFRCAAGKDFQKIGTSKRNDQGSFSGNASIGKSAKYRLIQWFHRCPERLHCPAGGRKAWPAGAGIVSLAGAPWYRGLPSDYVWLDGMARKSTPMRIFMTDSISKPLYSRQFIIVRIANSLSILCLSTFTLFPLFIIARGGNKTDIGILVGVMTLSSVLSRPPVS